MKNKLVSVYINVYNGEEYIKETVNSILNQTYKNIEVIIVNDCSTDNTLDVLNSIDDDRVKVYSLPVNSHVSVAVNMGLEHCSGEYIAHCDADDLWEPEKIQKQLDFLESHCEYGACFTYANVIDSKGNMVEENPFYEVFNIENRSQSEMFAYLCDYSNHFLHSSFFARKSVIDNVGKYDCSLPYLHDFDYWLRTIILYPIWVIEEKLTDYRVHENSLSSMNDGKWNSHDGEYQRIIKNAVKKCPDDLFLEAFKDRLCFEGEHTKEEVVIEKAFMLSKINTPLYDNPISAIEELSVLVNDPDMRKILNDKFSFKSADLFKLEEKRQYHNPKDYKRLSENLSKINDDLFEKEKTINSQSTVIADLEKSNSKLTEKNRTLSENLSNANDRLAFVENELTAIRNSFYWRSTALFRKAGQRVKTVVFKSRKLTLVCRAIKMVLLNGPKATLRKIKSFLNKRKKAKLAGVRIGIDISKSQREFEENYIFEKSVKFSVLVPLYNTPADLLKEMIDSVLCQTYKNFELCLADGSDNEHGYVGDYCKKLMAKDKRIVYKKLEKNDGISENTNACIDMSSGDYIALFDHDDLIHSSALFEYMKVICEQDADFIYCDEDKFEHIGQRAFDPYFKPDFAPDNLRANNYICHFTVFSRELLNIVGGFRKEFDGSQDHDLILRLTEKAKHVVHIPKLLYHWRVSAVSVASDPYAKPYAITAGINAVSEQLKRLGLKGTVESSKVHPNVYRIKYDIIGQPKISILIPNYNHIDEISRCINSIVEKSTYKNYEIIIIENNSNKETFDYYETLKDNPKIEVVIYNPNGEGFNYSKINNYGAKFASGDYILLLNNDVEVISPDWLQEMLMFAQREEVGAVGAMLYYPNDTLQHAGVIVGLGGVAGHSHKYFPRNSVGYYFRLAIQQNLSAVTAACVMMPKKVFEEIDGLDEDFKVAFNDVDMCMRIRQKGYLICFTPYAELYHHESISRGVEDTAEKQARFQGEIARFKNRWKTELENGDPYYNSNLTLDFEDFSIK